MDYDLLISASEGFFESIKSMVPTLDYSSQLLLCFFFKNLMSVVSMVKHRRDGAHLPSKHLGDWWGVILGCRPAQSTEKPKTGVRG